MRKPITILTGLAAVLAMLPFANIPASYESLLYLIFMWTTLAVSWNLLSGFSGYFSFGHGAFFGIGMYTTGYLTTKLNVPFLATLPIAGMLAAAFATLIGAIAFRVHTVRGELFSLLTLAATFVIATVILNTSIDGGSGIYMSGVSAPSLAPTASGTFYLLALLVAFATLMIALVIYHSRFGTGLFAIRDDEDAAEVMGVPTFRFKLAALAISSALAGVIGGVNALFVSYLTTVETFNVLTPLTVVLMAVLGGTRHWAGPAIGATAITLLLFSFTGGDSAVIGKIVMGVLLIAVILFMPNGLLGRLGVRRNRARVTAEEVGVNPNALAQRRSRELPVAEEAPVLLRTSKLAKSFNGVHALRGVDVEVRRGEILGLLGPNGSGKSTFINVVSGHYLATGGTAELRGERISGLPAHRVARSGVSRTYQIPRPFVGLTVLENVALTAMFSAARLGRPEAEAQAWKWLDFTGLAQHAAALPDALNLHQRKFLEFARALASGADILMLDEVLSGLTPSEIDNAVAMIRRIRDQGTTIVFVEHVMRAVHALCDRVVVFNRGEVLASGAPGEVLSRADVITAYLGKKEPAADTAPALAKPEASVVA
jgi:branched-chain amino acid transport system permease protein